MSEQYILPPIAEYEASPEFQGMSLDDQSLAIDGYYQVATQQAKTEDDYNRILQERYDRTRSAFQLGYRAQNPTATTYDPALLTDNLKALQDKARGYYADLNHNTKSEVQAFKADDVEGAGEQRALRIKPFKYQGEEGYSVIYPNGSYELVKGLKGRAQLTEFIRGNRLDRFNQDDNEYDQIYSKMTDTNTGLSGMTGEARKTWSSMLQGKDVFDVSMIRKSINKWNENQSTIDALQPRLDRLKKRPQDSTTRWEISELEQQIQEAKEGNLRTNSNLLDSRILAQLNPLAEGYAMSPEEAQPYLNEEYKSIIDEMLESQKIAGSSAIQQFRDHVQALPEDKKMEFGTFRDYFRKNPSEIIPYALSIGTGAIPDLMALGLVAGGTAALTGSPQAATAAGGAMSYFREYTGTLLSELQTKAANQNIQLTDEGVIDRLMNDPAFMAGVEEKAHKRAGAIGAADAVLTFGVDKITNAIKGAFSRAVLGGSLGAATEMMGEYAAQKITQDQIDWSEVVNEGLGSGPIAVGSVAAGAAKDMSKMRAQVEAARANLDAAKPSFETSAAVNLDERVKRMESFVGAPRVTTPQVPIQSGPNLNTQPPRGQVLAPGIARPGLQMPSAYDMQLAENRGNNQPGPISDNFPEPRAPIDTTAFEGETEPALGGEVEQPFSGGTQAALRGPVGRPISGQVSPFVGRRKTEVGLDGETGPTESASEPTGPSAEQAVASEPSSGQLTETPVGQRLAAPSGPTVQSTENAAAVNPDPAQDIVAALSSLADTKDKSPNDVRNLNEQLFNGLKPGDTLTIPNHVSGPQIYDVSKDADGTTVATNRATGSVARSSDLRFAVAAPTLEIAHADGGVTTAKGTTRKSNSGVDATGVAQARPSDLLSQSPESVEQESNAPTQSGPEQLDSDPTVPAPFEPIDQNDVVNQLMAEMEEFDASEGRAPRQTTPEAPANAEPTAIPPAPEGASASEKKRYENAAEYERTKAKLTRSQLTDIASQVGRYLSDVTKESFPRIYEAIEKGIRLFNRFLPFSGWMDAMRRSFVGVPDSTLKKIWNGISETAKVTIDSWFDFKTPPTTKLPTMESSEHNVRNVYAHKYIAGQVSPTSLAAAAVAQTQTARDAAVNKIKREIAEARFNQLKERYPNLLKDMEYNGVNLPEARQRVINSLYEMINNENTKTIQVGNSEMRRNARQDLINYRLLTVTALRDLINNPSYTESHASLMVSAVEYIMSRTSDLSKLSDNSLKFYANVLASFSDGGPPIGFKYIIPKALAANFAYRGKVLSKELFKKGGRLFFGPIANWIRRPLLGTAPALGSLVQQATEYNAMSATKESKKFLTDLVGTYKYNIDAFQLENKQKSDEFSAKIKELFPDGMDALTRMRIGLVARLTQWKLSPDALPPMAQIIQRYDEVVDSIADQVPNTSVKGAMLVHNKDKAMTTRRAVATIMGGNDIRTMGDENSMVRFLESQLTEREKALLDYVRSVGEEYLPTLELVKASTREVALDNWHNYIHDSTVTVKQKGEDNLSKNTNSLSDILQERKGVDPVRQYPDLDIASIGFHQIQASAYEKHTGMERHALSKAMDERSPLTALLDQDTDGINTVSGRILELTQAYHNAMTKPQESAGYVASVASMVLDSVLGLMIVGINAVTKNFGAAAVSRGSLASLSAEALGNGFLYNLSDPGTMRIINNFLKERSPTQYKRFNAFDTLEQLPSKWSSKERYGVSRVNGEHVAVAMLKAMPYLPKEALELFKSKIIDGASKLSNAIPERHHAFGIWFGAYTHYLKEAGLINNAADFLGNPVYDRAAMFQANEFVNRALGYSPDKASKGSTWHRDTASKHIYARLFTTFRQQGIGMSIEFQRNALNGINQLRAGSIAEARKSFSMAGIILGNYVTFKGLGMIMASNMLWGGLDRHINAADEEDEIAALNEAKRKNAETSARSNTKDFYWGVTEMMLPIAANGTLTQIAGNLAMHTTGAQFEPPKNLLELLTKVEVTFKKDMKAEIDEVADRIKVLKKAFDLADKRGEDTKEVEDELEKMELIHSQLTEKRDFSYVPSNFAKAVSTLLSSWGMGIEEMDNILASYVDNSIDPVKQAKLKNIMNEEFRYNKDELGGHGFANDFINNAANFFGALKTGNWGGKIEPPPTSVAIMSMMAAGQNPLPIIERARKAQAEQAYLYRERVMKQALELEKKMGYGPGTKSTDTYEGWTFPKQKK